MEILLSILIPTVFGRESELNALMNCLRQQVTLRMGTCFEKDGYVFMGEGDHFSPIEIIWLRDHKEMPIGEKRERLYSAAHGKYSLMIDDDDLLAPDAIQLIISAIETNPDCVTYEERCFINGIYFKSNHSTKYDDWGENIDGYDYVRTPFMKSVIKTDIARSVPIPHIRYGEDHEWAKSLKPFLHTEIHIDKEIYYYEHNSKPEDHNERYGIR